MSRITASTSRRGGFLRRSRAATGWKCPDCGLTSSDPVATRLGFCSRCSEFTGMCGAGRKIICPDMMTVTDWHTPCTSLGVYTWQVSQGASRQVAMLCRTHDMQLRNGSLPWLGGAEPLDHEG